LVIDPYVLTEVLTTLLLMGALIGGILDVIAALGMIRFKDFYLRLHALTVGVIGGSFYPLILLGLYSMIKLPYPSNYYVGGIALTTAFFILITAPAGSHAIARAAHRSKHVPKPAVVDRLREDRESGVMN